MPDVPLSVVDKEVFKLLNDYNVSFSKKKNRHLNTRKMTGILNSNQFIHAKSLAKGTFFSSHNYMYLCWSLMFHLPK